MQDPVSPDLSQHHLLDMKVAPLVTAAIARTFAPHMFNTSDKVLTPTVSPTVSLPLSLCLITSSLISHRTSQTKDNSFPCHLIAISTRDKWILEDARLKSHCI